MVSLVRFSEAHPVHTQNHSLGARAWPDFKSTHSHAASVLFKVRRGSVFTCSHWNSERFLDDLKK